MGTPRSPNMVEFLDTMMSSSDCKPEVLENTVRLLAFLALALFWTIPVMASDVTTNLEVIGRASHLADGVRGESATADQYFQAFNELSSNLSQVPDADLKRLLKNGPPAGRLYAALLWHRKYSGQKSKEFADSGLHGLLSQTKDVLYLSGCKGSHFKVNEIAESFLQKGRFMNFPADPPISPHTINSPTSDSQKEGGK